MLTPIRGTRRWSGWLLLLGLVLGACGSPAGSPSASAPTIAPPAPTVQPADRLYIHDSFKGAAERLTIVDAASGARVRDLPPGVMSPDWSTLYVATAEASSTRVQAIEIAGGQVLREIMLEGMYRLPMTTPDSVLGGLSPDGQWLALAANQPAGVVKPSRFVVLDTGFKQPQRTVDLPGIFEFDGLSNGATSLFLTESLTDNPHGEYQVRRYDLGLGSLDPNVVVAKGEDEPMNGVRQTAVASPDGKWLYSLYANPDHGPFIHALNLTIPVAFCLDLPTAAKDDLARQSRWSLALSGDGRTLYAVNGAIGQLAEVGISGDVPAVARTSTLFQAPPKATETAAPPPTSTISALAPDGSTIYTLSDLGLLVIDAKALELRGRYLADWDLDGLALSPDGARLYAASASAGKIVRLDPRAGTIVGEVATEGRPTGVVRVES